MRMSAVRETPAFTASEALMSGVRSARALIFATGGEAGMRLFIEDTILYVLNNATLRLLCHGTVAPGTAGFGGVALRTNHSVTLFTARACVCSRKGCPVSSVCSPLGAYGCLSGYPLCAVSMEIGPMFGVEKPAALGSLKAVLFAPLI